MALASNSLFYNLLGKHFVRNPMRMLGVFSIIAGFAVMVSGHFIAKQWPVTISGFTTILASIPLLFSPNRIQSEDEADSASDDLLARLSQAQETGDDKPITAPKSKLRLYSGVGAWNGGTYMWGMIQAGRPLDAFAGAVILGAHILNTLFPKPTSFLKDPQKISGRALQAVNILLVVAGVVAGDAASGIVGPLFIIANQGMSLANQSPEHPDLERIIHRLAAGSKELNLSPELRERFSTYATHYLRERGYGEDLGIGDATFTQLFNNALSYDAAAETMQMRVASPFA
jgi:hypothetical protein